MILEKNAREDVHLEQDLIFLFSGLGVDLLSELDDGFELGVVLLSSLSEGKVIVK